MTVSKVSKPAAMILAAGRGERMRPITDHTPKPLIEVNGTPLIDFHLHRLAQAGIDYVVINVCWLGHLIQAHVGNGERYGLQVEYSEEAKALETAGGIVQALRRFERLAQGEFLLINADVYCDNPIPQLLNLSLGENYGHLLLTETPTFLPGDFHLVDGLIHSRDDTNSAPLYTYCGVARYSPAWFERCPEGPQAMLPLFNHAIEQQRLAGSLLSGRWMDVGTPERLNMAESLLG